VLDLDTLMAAITGAEGQHSRDIGRDLPLKTAVLHKRRCSIRGEVAVSNVDRESLGKLGQVSSWLLVHGELVKFYHWK